MMKRSSASQRSRDVEKMLQHALAALAIGPQVAHVDVGVDPRTFHVAPASRRTPAAGMERQASPWSGGMQRERRRGSRPSCPPGDPATRAGARGEPWWFPPGAVSACMG